MEFEQIQYAVEDRIATITLNRPDRLNAFTPRMGQELLHAFDRVDGDDGVRVLVVTGAGRGFCAGADLGSGSGDSFYDPSKTIDDFRDGGGFVLSPANAVEPDVPWENVVAFFEAADEYGWNAAARS